MNELFKNCTLAQYPALGLLIRYSKKGVTEALAKQVLTQESSIFTCQLSHYAYKL